MDDAPSDGAVPAAGTVQISAQELSKATVELAVAGELDLATAPQLKWRLHDALQHGYANLVVNLDKVGFIDSTALSVLVGFVHRLPPGHSLALACVSGRVLRTIEIAGLDSAFMIMPSVDAARTALEDGTRR